MGVINPCGSMGKSHRNCRNIALYINYSVSYNHSPKEKICNFAQMLNFSAEVHF